MENLLWSCYKKGIKTCGCHAGQHPYLSLHVNNSENEVIKLLNVVQKINDSKIIVSPDGGNPFSGNDWYKPDLTIYFRKKQKDEVDKIFDLLNASLNEEHFVDVENNLFIQLLDLYDFFSYKESGLFFYAEYTNDYNYKFSILLFNRMNKFDYFNNLFTTAGLSLEQYNDQQDFKSWTIENKNLKELVSKVKKIIEYIISNYSLERPDSLEELKTLHEIALFKRREFGDSLEGKQKFEQWLQNERKKYIQ